MVSAAVVDEPGASEYFLGSFVSYSDLSKVSLLGVSQAQISEKSAVDPEIAMQMAKGARTAMAQANQLPIDSVVALSTTGVAGPDTVAGHRVGLVFFGISSTNGDRVVSEQFSGDRVAVREQAKMRALALIREEFTALLG
jgi:PncC family amidohydrolase